MPCLIMPSSHLQGSTYDPPCLHLTRVMKAPTRPLSKKREAEELLGRVHLPRFYALWQAAGAARRPAHLPLWTTGLRRDCPDHINVILSDRWDTKWTESL
jgi:hypothetical protein